MHILIVEDDSKTAAYLRKGLTENGFTVDVADKGEDGLHLARTGVYDLMILDVMLPEQDGWSVLGGIRQSGIQTPVLFLTARDSVQDRVKGLELGADDYLVKPFELAELFARLRALIRRSAGQADSSIDLGDVVIDTRAQTVSRFGQRIALTAREYALVELLALHRGRLVTRTMIYDHLFDENDDTLSNLVDVHIMNVRKKLGRDFITTRRGQGYVIDA